MVKDNCLIDADLIVVFLRGNAYGQGKEVVRKELWKVTFSFQPLEDNAILLSLDNFRWRTSGVVIPTGGEDGGGEREWASELDIDIKLHPFAP